MAKEAVNHPDHYNQAGIECIDAMAAATINKTGIEAVDVSNVIKYLWRYEAKNGVEDVKKAKWYLEHLIKFLESKQGAGKEVFKDKDSDLITVHFVEFFEWDSINPAEPNFMDKATFLLGDERFFYNRVDAELHAKLIINSKIGHNITTIICDRRDVEANGKTYAIFLKDGRFHRFSKTISAQDLDDGKQYRLYTIK